MEDIHAVIWDLDNTIVDSYEGHFQSWDAILKKHNIPHNREFFANHYGMSSTEVLMQFVGIHIEERDIAPIVEEKEELFREFIRDNPVTILPGVEQWLEYFRSQGIRQAVASSGTMANIVALIASVGLGDYFLVIETGVLLPESKPHPQLFWNTAAGLDVHYKNCLVLEDSLHGLEAALRADMRCIFVRENSELQEKKMKNLAHIHATREKQWIHLSSLEDKTPSLTL